ncbi:MAG: alpha/beta hydrolase, partial [Rubrivivax sp.]
MLNINRRHVISTAPALLYASAGAATEAAPGAHRFVPCVPARDGTPLHLLDWGQGRPVVFMHAWALNSAMWEYPMTAATDAGCRAVAFDRRGHGKTPDPGRGYDYATLADDLAAVLEALDLRGVTLVGHSMGCTEIATYLQRHGRGRVSRVVFVSSPGPDAQGGPMLDNFLAPLKHDRPGALTGAVGLFTGPASAPASPMAQWVLSQFLQTSPLATRECLRLAMQVPMRPVLGAVKVPTLLVHGGQDALN